MYSCIGFISSFKLLLLFFTHLKFSVFLRELEQVLLESYFQIFGKETQNTKVAWVHQKKRKKCKFVVKKFGHHRSGVHATLLPQQGQPEFGCFSWWLLCKSNHLL